MHVTHSTTFRCPPRVLWSWIDDPEKCKQWLRGLEEVRPESPGPRRPGYRAKLLIREGRRLSEYDQTILDYEPEQRFHIKMEGGCLRGMAVEVDYRLTELGEGGTRLDYQCHAETKGFLRIFGFLFALFGRIQVRSFFRNLKRLAESDALAGAAG